MWQKHLTESNILSRRSAVVRAAAFQAVDLGTILEKCFTLYDCCLLHSPSSCLWCTLYVRPLPNIDLKKKDGKYVYFQLGRYGVVDRATGSQPDGLGSILIGRQILAIQ